MNAHSTTEHVTVYGTHWTPRAQAARDAMAAKTPYLAGDVAVLAESYASLRAVYGRVRVCVRLIDWHIAYRQIMAYVRAGERAQARMAALG